MTREQTLLMQALRNELHAALQHVDAALAGAPVHHNYAADVEYYLTAARRTFITLQSKRSVDMN